jgi:hypothetical protein
MRGAPSKLDLQFEFFRIFLGSFAELNMKLKNIALAAMLAGSVFGGNAYAEDFTVPLTQSNNNPSRYTAFFGNVPDGLEGTSFTDTFTFTPELFSNGRVSSGVINIALGADNELTPFSASLNGLAFTASATEAGVYTLRNAWLSPGPLVLTITGLIGADGGSYAGNINLLAVPEPETYGMMLGGLALLGYMARRRKQLG